MQQKTSNRGPLITTVSTFSALFGLSGLEHGFFELLQGRIAPGGLLISAIGPAQRFWPKGTETAFTLIPNMAITGAVAMVFSAAVILWSLFGMRRKHAWLLLLLLSICQFLTGGGFAQIFLSVTISVIACRVNQPLSWWKKHIPESVRKVVGAPWIALYVLFIALFVGGIEVAVFGFPYGTARSELTYQTMMVLSYAMIATFSLAVVSSLSRQSLKE
jgi:hypothetical protein